MRSQFKLYSTEFGKTFSSVLPAIATISSLSGIIFSTNTSIAGYAFPPVGGLRPMAGVLCLVVIFVGFLLGSTFIKCRRTTALTIVFAAASLVCIAVYMRAWQKSVVTVPIPSIGSSRSTVIGSERTGLAKPNLQDEQIVHDQGDSDDRIFMYYTRESTERRRLILCLLYGALLLSVTLCAASIVAGRVREILRLI